MARGRSGRDIAAASQPARSAAGSETYDREGLAMTGGEIFVLGKALLTFGLPLAICAIELWRLRRDGY
jgi:hypothetical protein